MEPVMSDDFYDQLGQVLRQQHKERAEELLKLAGKVFELSPEEEFINEPASDIAGFIACLREFMASFQGDMPKLRCFNPSIEEDGWEHRYTHIFVLQRDMAFLVDSLTMALNRDGVGIHVVNSTVLDVERDVSGKLVRLCDEKTDQSVREALIYFQIDRTSDEELQQAIVRLLSHLLQSVLAVNEDYQPSLKKINDVIDNTENNYSNLPQELLEENLNFLKWVRDNHFTFLAYAYYAVTDEEDPLITHLADGELGLFRISSREIDPCRLSNLAPGFRDFHCGSEIITLAKSSMRSHIHRDAYCDYVVVKDFNVDGVLVGEHRFLGLYTSLVYTQTPFSIPLVRQKLLNVYEKSGLSASGHDGKSLRQIIEVHPREELLHAPEDQLYKILIGIWQIQERRQVRLFIRTDPFEKFITCIVYFPKDSYSTEVRLQTEAMLREAMDATETQFNTFFTESLLVRTHFVMRIRSDQYRHADVKKLEKSINHLTHDWRDVLKETLIDHWGDERGIAIANEYRDAFPSSYREVFDPRAALHDIELFLPLVNENELAMSFYQPPGVDDNIMRFKVFHLNSELLLSNMVPMLENLGFLVIGEHPYEIVSKKGVHTWLHEFTLKFSLDMVIDVPGVRNNFQDAFEAIWKNMTDDDSFNWLVVGARLDWRSVSLLRLYARYFKQVGISVSQEFIARTLANNLDITRNLVALFKSLFDPKLPHEGSGTGERCSRIKEKILGALDSVENLNEDQVLRAYLDTICATVRTNFFQKTHDGKPKSYISIKLKPKSLALLPPPRPEYEVFVYSPRFEGVHLRAGKVARGGIRWSDRIEDYRTEILGLVKAQQVKNAVIVPAGAKGGFVAKQLPVTGNRDTVTAEAIMCYQQFISSLLDITDNVRDGQTVAPQDVVALDDDDAYLVVAADKGTASFSDIANKLSSDYQHWLGDAFASGGSNGYDHKKMGITARGAWVAVQRHFRELGLNTQSQPFTVVGIGDMSGDVFGNGMLLSPCIKLVAAFNHQSIFLDPHPDNAKTHAERQRLFNLPRSSWDDYDRSIISTGGGIYSRSLKSITLSEEVRTLLGVSDLKMTPAQLIRSILSAQVDLIWNGGIGTYVKGSHQTNAEVGDRTNDEVRVDGKSLRCRVFGEGGNLGMTQLGRVEFALNGGACNTDFIDNVGGVDCSDQEVNIKILLNQLVVSEDLTNKQRNELLHSMTDDVAQQVLGHSYRQTQGITLAEYKCRENFSEFWHCVTDWEADGILDRQLENLPDDDTIAERQKNGKVLTRPELSVLVSYAKIVLKQALLSTDIVDEPYFNRCLEHCFPSAMFSRFKTSIESHPLRREIIANYLANDLVDLMGLTFFHRQNKSTGAHAGEVIRAFTIVRQVLDLDKIWAEIEALDYQQSAQDQAMFLLKIMRLGRRSTRWIIRNRRGCVNTETQIRQLQPILNNLMNQAVELSVERPEKARNDIHDYLEKGLSPYGAVLIDSANDLFFAFGMADVAIKTGLPLELVNSAYSLIEDQLQIEWFSRQIIDLTPITRWEDYARESFMDDLESLFRSLVIMMLEPVSELAELEDKIDSWQTTQSVLLERWRAMIQELKASSQRQYAMFSVALRELQDLVDSTREGTLSPLCEVDE